MQIQYTKQAIKALSRMQPGKAHAIQAKIRQIASGNTAGLNIIPMQGMEGIFRLRAGDYRMIYEIKKDALVLIVIRVGTRGDVYK